MSRQQMVIAVLMASAGVMGGMLALMPTSRVVYGDVQAGNAGYTLLTARAVENGDDGVIVLENKTGKMMTYQFKTDAAGNARLLLTQPVDLNKLNKPRP